MAWICLKQDLFLSEGAYFFVLPLCFFLFSLSVYFFVYLFTFFVCLLFFAYLYIFFVYFIFLLQYLYPFFYQRPGMFRNDNCLKLTTSNLKSRKNEI